MDQEEADLRNVLRQTEAARGPDAVETAVAHHDLGQHLLESGAFADAEQHIARAHVGFARHFGTHHAFTLSCVVNLGVAIRAQGRLREALDLFDAVAQARMALLGPQNPLTENAMALVEDAQTRIAEAEGRPAPPGGSDRRGWFRGPGR
jgi:hypothetical protein